jgi:hypothetical protein
MEEQLVRCNNCYWEGSEDELKTFVDLSDNDISHDIQYFRGCPNCETDDCLMNIDDDQLKKN